MRDRRSKHSCPTRTTFGFCPSCVSPKTVLGPWWASGQCLLPFDCGERQRAFWGVDACRADATALVSCLSLPPGESLWVEREWVKGFGLERGLFFAAIARTQASQPN